MTLCIEAVARVKTTMFVHGLCVLLCVRKCAQLIELHKFDIINLQGVFVT